MDIFPHPMQGIGKFPIPHQRLFPYHSIISNTPADADADACAAPVHMY